jgi:bla regulator protein BlaR1
MQEFLGIHWLASVLKASWQAGVLILLVLAVQWAFGRRLSPGWRYGLWLLVVARLALPWTIPSSVSVFNLLGSTQAREAVGSLRAGSAAPDSPAAERAATVPAAGPEATAAGRTAAAAGGFGVSLSQVLVVWAAGALALGVCLVTLHYGLLRRVGRCRPLIDAPVLVLLEDCKQAMGLRVPVTLVETAAVGSPSLFGFVRPRLPFELHDRL